MPLIANSDSAPRHDDVTTIAFARDLLNSVEPYGVLITGGDNDTFPLWYAQEVEGIRKDVTIAVLSLMNTDWFARGIIRRPVYEYDAMRGPAIYRDRAWPKPDGPPLRLTLAEADSVPPYLIVSEPLRFRQKGVDAVIDPRNLIQVQGGGLLERSDLLVLRMIADSWPQRPIYISRTTGNYAARLGLQDHVVSQGLARKLSPARDSVPPNLIFVEGSGWLDIERSRALWTEDMVGPDALLKLGNWVDQPYLSTPFSYLLAGSELAEALRNQPGIEVEGVSSHLATADDESKVFTFQQYKAFREALTRLDWIPLPHIANTAALLDMPEMSMGLVRGEFRIEAAQIVENA